MKNKKNFFITCGLIILTLVAVLTFQYNSLKAEKKNAKITEEEILSKNLEDLTVEELEKLREIEVDKNLQSYKNQKYTSKDIRQIKNNILRTEWSGGLVNFINNNYKDLKEKDKLIKEVKILKYLNSINKQIKPEGEFFQQVNQSYEISNYLKSKNIKGDILSYENIKFIIQNIKEVSNFVDYDEETLVLMYDPEYMTFLTKQERKEIKKEWENVFEDEDLQFNLRKQIAKFILN